MHRLAIIFGRTVAEVNDTLGAAEFENWKRYYNQEPFGAERDNWHMAVLASLFANSLRQKNSDPKTRPVDFFYNSVSDSKERETQATLAALAAMAQPKPEAQT